MAVCGRDCESDSKMQYCRAFYYKIDENRCTVVSFNEKLIKNMQKTLGKQWFFVQRIKHTNDFQCFWQKSMKVVKLSFKIRENQWKSVHCRYFEIKNKSKTYNSIRKTMISRANNQKHKCFLMFFCKNRWKPIRVSLTNANRLWGDCETIVRQTQTQAKWKLWRQVAIMVVNQITALSCSTAPLKCFDSIREPCQYCCQPVLNTCSGESY